MYSLIEPHANLKYIICMCVWTTDLIRFEHEFDRKCTLNPCSNVNMHFATSIGFNKQLTCDHSTLDKNNHN